MVLLQFFSKPTSIYFFLQNMQLYINTLHNTYKNAIWLKFAVNMSNYQLKNRKKSLISNTISLQNKLQFYKALIPVFIFQILILNVTVLKVSVMKLYGATIILASVSPAGHPLWLAFKNTPVKFSRAHHFSPLIKFSFNSKAHVRRAAKSKEIHSLRSCLCTLSVATGAARLLL